MVSDTGIRQMLAIIIASYVQEAIVQTEHLIIVLPYFVLNLIPISQSCH